MADIHDYQESARETDDALRSLDSFCGSVEDGMQTDSGDGRALVLALGLGLRAVALAIREASTRADYVARDGARRG